MVVIFPDEGGAELETKEKPDSAKKLLPSVSFPQHVAEMGDIPLVDVHEPEVMKSMLGQVGFDQYHLNSDGWADYYWLMHDGKPRHVERKTWAELNALDKVEEQIHRHLTKQPDAMLTWVLEGVATPSDNGYETYKETTSKGRTLFVPVGSRRRPMKMLHAWLYQIGKFVEVLQTSTLFGTANLITAMYQADQREEHSTLHRYYKKVEWHPNPQVSKLIAIADGIGEKRAEALIERFGTIWAVLSNTPAMLSTVEGIGMGTARKVLQKAGRPDV